MAVRTELMRPLFAESFDLARFRCGDLFPVFGDRDIVMADKAFTDSLVLMFLMIEGNTVFEFYDVGGKRTGGK